MRKPLIIALCLTIVLAGCAGNLSTDRQFDDAVVAQRVSEALQNDADLARYEIGVTVNSGQVTLTGTVRSQADVSKAGRIAETVPQVLGVQNLITVGGVAGVVK